MTKWKDMSDAAKRAYVVAKMAPKTPSPEEEELDVLRRAHLDRAREIAREQDAIKAAIQAEK
ncbi:MAG: hypothetical protein A2Y74_09965 [Actinobacteria bacterium RBG_13_63_9]|nr:MAG: hypothetical protein A2Y74_09965 [Actinobacteria bacterium RBG_13_63_9]